MASVEEPYFSFNPKLLKVLNIQDKYVTKMQVINCLQKYLYTKRLFNPSNLKEMVLGKDPLGEIFGVETFLARNTMNLLAPLMSVVKKGDIDNGTNEASGNSESRVEGSSVIPSSGSSSCPVTSESFSREAASSESSVTENNKRKETEELPPAEKRTKHEPHLSNILPTYHSSDESDSSVQSKETQHVHNSRNNYSFYDDPFYNGSSSSDFNDCDQFELEYEVESVKTGNEVSDTDSDIEDIIFATVLECKDDSDMQFWADNSEEEQQSDPELSDLDKWSCKKCGVKNKPPFRFCHRCWNERNHWLPDSSVRHPPAPRRRKAGLKSRQIRNSTISDRVVAQSSSQELPSTSQDSVSNSPNQICPLCMIHQKTGIFIHGRTGHQYCCYQCARKIEKSGQKCPVCRASIKYVIRSFCV